MKTADEIIAELAEDDISVLISTNDEAHPHWSLHVERDLDDGCLQIAIMQDSAGGDLFAGRIILIRDREAIRRLAQAAMVAAEILDQQEHKGGNAAGYLS